MSSNKIEFNVDELEAPEWLNVEFFTKVLRHSEKAQQIQVKDVQLSPGTAKGDHYASVMFRAKLDYEQNGANKTKSVICKTMPEGGNKKELLGSSKIFETEIGMYTEVVPMMERMLRKTGDDTKLCANCIYHSLEPRKLMIFEDLVQEGYAVLRDREVNDEEAKAAYLKLAKWHAISYKVALEDPKLLEKYCYGIFTLDNWLELDFMTKGIHKFIELLDSIEELRSYKPYFVQLQNIHVQKCVDTFTEYQKAPVKGLPYVLCHGDFHAKNMMFKHDPETGKLQDVMLLDFQLSYMGPMVNDLIYSRFMLLDKEMRLHRFDEFLHYYFTNFLDILNRLGFKGPKPTLLQLHQQLAQHRHFELFLLVTFLPMWCMFRRGDIENDKMIESDDYRKTFYQNAEFQAEIRNLLPYYLHKGYLEF